MCRVYFFFINFKYKLITLLNLKLYKVPKFKLPFFFFFQKNIYLKIKIFNKF